MYGCWKGLLHTHDFKVLRKGSMVIVFGNLSRPENRMYVEIFLLWEHIWILSIAFTNISVVETRLNFACYFFQFSVIFQKKMKISIVRIVFGKCFHVVVLISILSSKKILVFSTVMLLNNCRKVTMVVDGNKWEYKKDNNKASTSVCLLIFFLKKKH